MTFLKKIQWDALLMPLVGLVLTLLAWQLVSGSVTQQTQPDGTV